MSDTSFQTFQADMDKQFASLPNRREWIETYGTEEAAKQAYSMQHLPKCAVLFNAQIINDLGNVYPSLNTEIPEVATFAKLIAPLIAEGLAKEREGLDDADYKLKPLNYYQAKMDYKTKCATLKKKNAELLSHIAASISDDIQRKTFEAKWKPHDEMPTEVYKALSIVLNHVDSMLDKCEDEDGTLHDAFDLVDDWAERFHDALGVQQLAMTDDEDDDSEEEAA